MLPPSWFKIVAANLASKPPPAAPLVKAVVGVKRPGQKPSRIPAVFAAILALAMRAVSVAQADTYYFDTNGATGGYTSATGATVATGTWASSGTTWSTDNTGYTATSTYATGLGDTLYFSAAVAPATGTAGVYVTVSGTQNAGWIYLQNPGPVNIGGTSVASGSGVINLANGLVENVNYYATSGSGVISGTTSIGTGVSTIYSAITLDPTWTTGTISDLGGNASLVLNGSISGLAGTGTTQTIVLNNNSAQPNGLKLGGVIADGPNGGKVALTASNASSPTDSIYLGGTNTFSGGVTLAFGRIVLGSASALGTGTLTLAGGQIDAPPVTITGVGVNQTPLTLATNNAQVWSGNFGYVGTNGLNMGTGAVTLSPASGSAITVQVGDLFTTNAGVQTLTEGGVIGDGGSGYGIMKTGHGILVLNGIDTYKGTTTIMAGDLRATDGVGLGTTGLLNIGGGYLESSGTFTRNVGSSAGQVEITAGVSGFSAYGGALTVALGGTTTPTGLTLGSATFNPGTLLLNASTANSAMTFVNGIALSGASLVVKSNSPGNAATMSGAISGNGGLVKGGNGVLVLGANNSYSGVTSITGGELRAAGVSSLGSAPDVVVNAGAGLGLGSDPTQGTLQSVIDPTSAGYLGLDGVTTTHALSLSTLGNGSMYLGSATTGTYGGSSLGVGAGNTYYLGAGGGTLTVSQGALSGNAALVVGSTLNAGTPWGPSSVAVGTVNLQGNNSATGATTVNYGGGLALDFTAGASNNIISSASALTLNNTAALNVSGKAGATNSQAFNGMTLNSGLETVGVTSGAGGSASLALGAITRNSGAVVYFTTPASGNISTSTGDGSGIVGPWAFVGTGTNTHYAGVSGNIISAYNGATAVTGSLANMTSASTNYSTAASTTIGSSVTGNTLSDGTNAQVTLTTAAGSAYNVTLNGILNSGTNLLTLAPGSGATGGLVIGNGGDLVINAAGGPVTISMPIVNGAGSTNNVTLTGTGVITTSATNNGFTGVLTIDGATWAASASLQSMSSVVLNSGTFNINTTGTGSFVNTNLTINGGALFVSTSSGNRGAFKSYTFNNSFGVYGGSADSLGSGTVTLGNNVAMFIDQNGGTSNLFTIGGVITDNGNGYGITKTGLGVLQLSATNTFSGPMVVNAGALSLGGNPQALGYKNTLYLNSGAYISWGNGGALTIAGLNDGGDGGGTVRDDGSTGTIGLVLLGNDVYNFSGSINEPGTVSYSVTKEGAGTQILSGSSSWLGGGGSGMVLNAGSLVLDMNAGGGIAATSGSFKTTFGGGNFTVKGSANGGSTETLDTVTLTGSTGSTLVLNSNGGSATTLVFGANPVTSGSTAAWSRGANSTLNINLTSTNTAVYGLPMGIADVYTSITPTSIVAPWMTVTTPNGTGFGVVQGGLSAPYASSGSIIAYTKAATPVNVSGSITVGSGTNYVMSTTGTLSNALHTISTMQLNTASNPVTLDLGGSSDLLTNSGFLMTGANNGTIQNGQIGAANSEVIMHQFGSGLLTISALVSSGSGSLTLDGTGVLNLTAPNTYTGVTQVNGGVLRATDGTGLPTSSLLNLNNGVFETGGTGSGLFTRTSGTAQGNVELTNGTSGFSAYGAALSVALGGTASPTALTWGIAGFGSGLAGSGTMPGGPATFAPAALVLNAASANNTINFENAVDLNGQTRTILVNSPGYAATMSGVLSNSQNGNTGGLVKGGVGTLILSGSNTYAGVTMLNTGTLNLANQNAIQNSTLTMNGGSLVFDQSVSGHGYTLGGLAAASSGAGYNIALLNNASNPVAVALSVGGNNASTTYAGVLSGAGSLSKNGNGTLILSGSNIYTGVTMLNAGIVNLGIAESTGSYGPLGNSAAGNPGSIVLTGGTLQYSALNQNDYSGRFSTAAGQQYNVDTNGQTVTWATALTSVGGSLSKSGVGKLTLNGTNTYSGATTVNAGTLVVNGLLGNSASVSVNNGSTLQIGQNNAINSASTLSLNNGTLDLNGKTQTLGSLMTLSGSSNILLTGSAAKLTLADSSSQGAGWNGALTIQNWTANAFGASGTNQIFFGNGSGSGLTAGQLADIVFLNPIIGGTSESGMYLAEMQGTGELEAEISLPAVTVNPVGQTGAAGGTVSFTAAATGSPLPTMQWQVSSTGTAGPFSNIDSVANPSATTGTLTLSNITLAQNGYAYQAVFTNTAGSATTTSATLMLLMPPTVTTNPTQQTVIAGMTAVFTAAATGNPAPTVQWQVSSTGTAGPFSNITGNASATTGTLSLPGVTLAQNGYAYRAVFTNSLGSATTSAVTLVCAATPYYVLANPNNVASTSETTPPSTPPTVYLSPTNVIGHPCTLWVQQDINNYLAALPTNPVLQSNYNSQLSNVNRRLTLTSSTCTYSIYGGPISLPGVNFTDHGVPIPQTGTDGSAIYLGDCTDVSAYNGGVITQMGMMYALTGSQQYGEYARQMLVSYANYYSQYGHPPGWTLNKYRSALDGRLSYQFLNDEFFLCNIAFAYDLIRNLPTLTSADQDNIRVNLLEAIAAEFTDPILGTPDYLSQGHNRSALAAAGVLMAGYASDDSMLINEALYGTGGTAQNPTGGITKVHMGSNILPDGLWIESSIGYQTSIAACGVFDAAIMMEHHGIDAFGQYPLKRLLDSAIEMAYPNGNMLVPNVGNTGPTALLSNLNYSSTEIGFSYWYGYLYYQDPSYLPIIRNQQQQLMMTAHNGAPGLFLTAPASAWTITQSSMTAAITSGSSIFTWLMSNGYFDESFGTEGDPVPLSGSMISSIQNKYPAQSGTIVNILQTALSKEVPPPINSANFFANGYGILRLATGPQQLLVEYGDNNKSHGQPAALSLDIYALGGTLMSLPGDIFPYNDPLDAAWYWTTLANNTVTVDGSSQIYGGNYYTFAKANQNPYTAQIVFGPALTMGIQKVSSTGTNSVYAQYGVAQDRAVFMSPNYTADLFGNFSSTTHTYDLAWHPVGDMTTSLSLSPRSSDDFSNPGYNSMTNLQNAFPTGSWTAQITMPNGNVATLYAAANPLTEVIIGTGHLLTYDSGSTDILPPVILERNSNVTNAIFGNVIDVSGSSSGYVNGVTQEGDLNSGYALLKVQTVTGGTDLCYTSYQPGTFTTQENVLTTDAQQAFVMMNGTNVQGMYLGGGTTLTVAGGSIGRVDSVTPGSPGLAYVELTTTGYVVGNMSPTNATVTVSLPGVGSGTASINANSTIPSLSVGNAAVVNVISGTTGCVFTVTLSETSSQTVTVNYATADGSAVSGNNYIAQSGVLTFAPGVTVQTITVPVVGNPDPAAPNLMFTVNLSGAVNAMALGSQGTGTIWPTIIITSALTATGTNVSAFSYTITALNNPTSFNATGLPTGLSIDTSTGVISGTPTATGTFSSTISAANAGGSVSATLVLTILPPPPVINSALTATGTTGSAFSYPITATNSPTSFNTSLLPTGLSINTSTGVISGTPTVTGTSSVTISASNAGGSGSATLVLTVLPPPPVITSTLAATGTNGSAFSYPITATNSPTSFNASLLPTGLSINTSTGVISGTPTATGTSSVTISASNAGGSGSATLVLTVLPPPPVITSTLTATGTNGSAFSYPITATNSPTSFNASLLPTGLSINTSTGVISGTPTATGISSVTISATNAGGSGSATLVLTVLPPPPVITSTLTATGTNGSAFSYPITATNSPTSFNATGLPTGLSINTSTGVISGTPSVTGTSSVTISASNAGGSGSATLVLTVLPPPPVINSALTATGTIGRAFSYPITATNSPTSFNATSLPTGLSVNTATGVISGTPTVTGTFSPTLFATNAGGSGSATMVLTIPPASTSITSVLTATGTIGSAFSYTITATNNPTSFNATGLPAGLNVNSATGVVSGTPTVTGTFTATLFAINAGGTGSAALVLTILPAHIVYEGFDYPVTNNISTSPDSPNDVGLTGTTWTAGANKVIAGLTYPGLTCIGNAIQFSSSVASARSIDMSAMPAGFTQVDSDSVTRLGKPGTTLWFSFLIRTDAADVGGTQTAGLEVLGAASGGGMKMRIGNTGTTGGTNGYWSVMNGGSTVGASSIPIVTGSTVLLVTRVQFVAGTNNDQVDLFVNPPLGPTPPAVPDATLRNLDISTFDRIQFKGGRQSTADEFAMATDWKFLLMPTLLSSPPGITSALAATGTNSSAFSYTITASNSPTSFNATGLPDGLSIDTVAGVISGTPTATGTFSSTISSTNVVGTGSATLVLTILPPPPSVTSALTATGTNGSAFSYRITATSSPTSFNANGLPTGLSVNTSTGVISGTATATGTFSSTISATNPSGSGSATLALTILPTPPSITSALTASGTNGIAFGGYMITASNSPTSYNATGLPTGLSINTATGAISGTPSATGNFSVTISASNGGGTGSITLALSVLTRYEAWKAQKFTAAQLLDSNLSGDLAILSGDGICNLTKYALGLAPSVHYSNSAVLPYTQQQKVSGTDRLTITFTRDTNATDVSYSVEAADSLIGSWTAIDPLDAANQVGVLADTPAPGIQTITAKDIHAMSDSARRFMRLRMTVSNASGPINSVTTPVAGYVNVTCKASSDTIVSAPLSHAPDYVGAISGTATIVGEMATVSASGTAPAGWSANQFAAYYASTPSYPTYYIKFISGALNGKYYTVVSNSTNSVSFDTGGDNVAGAATNDQFSLVKYWTIGELFPSATQNTFVVSGGNLPPLRKSMLLLPDLVGSGINLAPNQKFFITAGGWKKDDTGYPDGSKQILYPDTYFIVRHPDGADTSFVTNGSVNTDHAIIPFSTLSGGAQDNFIALQRPEDVTLALSGLSTGFVPSANNLPPTRRDVLLVFDNTQIAKNKAPNRKFFMVGSNWIEDASGYPSANNFVLSPGTGFIVRKYKTSSGTTALWANDPNY